MATAKHTQTTPDGAIEHLLAEIASTAYFTERRLRSTPGDSTELFEFEADLLRNTMARLGWLADMALQRLGSVNCLQDGRAESWLLAPLTNDLLAVEVQS